MQIWRDLSREAHLWYTITSADFVNHAKPQLQTALDVIREGIKHEPLAADYPPVPFWGGVVEHLLLSFDNAVIALMAGEFGPMVQLAGRLMDVPRGFSESVQWLPSEANARMLNAVETAYGIFSRFLRGLTMSQRYSSDDYKNGSTAWRYELPKDAGFVSNNILRNTENSVYEVVGRPALIPEYAHDANVVCKTGDIVSWTGVWVPTTGMGTAALAFARQGIQIMQPAYELAREFAEGDHIEATKLVDTSWHPVKPTGRMIPLPPAGAADDALAATSASSGSGRCKAGDPCPREGYWFTPAKAGSRRHFQQGETMPEFKSDYGLTIWQWDDDQAS
ncbi:hypothetical protein [Ideonella sp. YS5]|uniref:hypothetical protein n=1 Tax=Ideonella sp. YS5 TaxID=3453714 RepID=UPI003EF02B55